jgi:hypothetical protein
MGALESGFAKSPNEQCVDCYWYWIDNKITKEGVVADLHAMKKPASLALTLD